MFHSSCSLPETHLSAHRTLGKEHQTHSGKDGTLYSIVIFIGVYSPEKREERSSLKVLFAWSLLQ